MALITKFERITMTKNKIHEPASCTYSIFDDADGRYLQIDTYGSSKRRIKGKKSQTIQLDKAGGRELVRIISEAFG